MQHNALAIYLIISNQGPFQIRNLLISAVIIGDSGLPPPCPTAPHDERSSSFTRHQSALAKPPSERLGATQIKDPDPKSLKWRDGLNRISTRLFSKPVAGWWVELNLNPLGASKLQQVPSRLNVQRLRMRSQPSTAQR